MPKHSDDNITCCNLLENWYLCVVKYNRIAELKTLGRKTMGSRLNDELRPSGLTDYFQIHGLLISPMAHDGFRSRLHMEGLKKSQEEECGKQQFCGADCPQNRWSYFPSVSPVYNGNDGILFDISHFAVPFPGRESSP